MTEKKFGQERLKEGPKTKEYLAGIEEEIKAFSRGLEQYRRLSDLAIKEAEAEWETTDEAMQDVMSSIQESMERLDSGDMTPAELIQALERQEEYQNILAAEERPLQAIADIERGILTLASVISELRYQKKLIVETLNLGEEEIIDERAKSLLEEFGLLKREIDDLSVKQKSLPGIIRIYTKTKGIDAEETRSSRAELENIRAELDKKNLRVSQVETELREKFKRKK